MRPDRSRRSAPTAALAALVLLAACTPPSNPQPSGEAGRAPMASAGGTRLEDVRDQLHALAHDSMMGRFTGEEGMWRSARYIARRLQAAGVEPAGDDGFFQRMPLGIVEGRNGRLRPALLSSWADTAGVPAERRRVGVNVVGILRGADPVLREQAVVIGAHFDHLGVGRAVDGDSVYNGADDDASGVVTVIEVARELARGPRPKRTVIFLLTTGEEVGMVGTNWYLDHPVVPLERTVADLQVEMIGRPDTAAGGPGKAWLTGYERSTMGEMLAASQIPIVADPRPAQQFFLRSDNIAFAYRGIPAHTLSSFGLHGDYHTPDDEVERIDFAHMTEVIRAAARAARVLADGPAPQWKPEGRPTPPGS